QARLVKMIKDALKAKVQPNFQGEKAVGLNIVLVEVRVIAGSQSVFVGGNHALRAALYVEEIKSGYLVASNHELFSLAGYSPSRFLSLNVETGWPRINKR
ncbi:MAG: hypothetical protein VW618_11930, partial [Alphaproteobacteria bacterium]